jgi:hypothetical protein
VEVVLFTDDDVPDVVPDSACLPVTGLRFLPVVLFTVVLPLVSLLSFAPDSFVVP